MKDRVAETKDKRDVGYVAEYGPSNRGWGAEAQEGTDTNSRHYQLFKKVVNSTMYQDDKPIPTIPGLMIGSTECRHYALVSRQKCIRMYPFMLTVGDAQAIHGDDEKVRISAWREGLCLVYNMFKMYGDEL
ncbi:MAG: hypothetical protein J3K34DRAFT_464704 [Monoraphidium minutum]|nr:MAG: hypothetical protein J3K34DRAFT_464704 [Monoraphidium minutum]